MMMKRWLKQKILILFTGTLPVLLYAGGSDKSLRVLYNFEQDGTAGWFEFNSNVEVELKQEKVKNKGVLIIKYKYGADSFLGVGVKPAFVLDKDPKAWHDYAKGFFRITVDADKPQELTIELRLTNDDGSYFAKVPIKTRMKSYDIPFADFKNKGKGLDLSDKEVEQIILVPARGENKSHTITVDEVVISAKKLK